MNGNFENRREGLTSNVPYSLEAVLSLVSFSVSGYYHGYGSMCIDLW